MQEKKSAPFDKNYCRETDKKSLEEALHTLSRYNSYPFTEDFMRIHSIPTQNTQQAKLAAIAKKIRKKTTPPYFPDLIEYIDTLKSWGKQQIFLFKLQNDRGDYLNRLFDPEFIQNSLGKNKEIYNKNQCIWKSQTPALAEVRHNTNIAEKTGLILLKWVETRRYLVRRGLFFQVKEERAVTFFNIDLRDGSAQLRIQTLMPRSLTSLKETYDLYITEINKYIEFHRFSQVFLEPVMKKFLYRRILPITNWRIRLKSGDLQGNNTAPTFMEKLKLPFQNFFPKEITIRWNCHQTATNREALFFTLNGNQNSINFNAVSDKTRVNFILEQIKMSKSDSRKIPIEMKELRILAEDYPESHHLISMMDYYFSHLNKKRISLKTIEAETWRSSRKITEIFKLTAQRFPHSFQFASTKKITFLEFIRKFQFSEGLQDHIIRKYNGGRREILKTRVTRLAFLTAILIGVIIPWLIQETIEKIFGFSYIYLQLLLFLMQYFIYYGGKRIGKYFYRKPKSWLLRIIRYLSGSPDFPIISSKEYETWMKTKSE